VSKINNFFFRFVRSFCSGQNGGVPVKDITSVPLSQPLPNFPQAKHAIINTHTYDTNVTTLDNGLKVATENKFGEFCTVGGKYFNIYSIKYSEWCPGGNLSCILHLSHNIL
jgi:hypothetical protein